MGGNIGSEFGKKVSSIMSSLALSEAKFWADRLMDEEFKGRGDREKSARYRLAQKCGVPESYLFRLQYKTREMKDVAGSVYRALKIAYDEACRANEDAADRYKAERQKRRDGNEKADQKPTETTQGMGSFDD